MQEHFVFLTSFISSYLYCLDKYDRGGQYIPGADPVTNWGRFTNPYFTCIKWWASWWYFKGIAAMITEMVQETSQFTAD